MKKLKLSKAFTLIELLTIMVIITILAGMVVGVGSSVRRQARKAKAKSMISALELAIGVYHADTGIYPPDGYDGGCSELYPKLASTGTVFKNPALPAYIPGWNGPYMEFDSDDLMQRSMPVGTATTIKDPWGNEYKYDQSSPPNNISSFDLWSIGEDGINGTSDDITNW